MFEKQTFVLKIFGGAVLCRELFVFIGVGVMLRGVV